MLVFISPYWLGTLPAVAAAGVWGLWRGRNRRRGVSSIRLWQGVTPTASARPRYIDPVWLLVFIAALFAAAALARPAWTSHSSADLPAADMEWNIRSLDGATARSSTEAWIHLRHGANPLDPLTLTVETDAGNEQHPVSFTQLRAGIPITIFPAATRATLSLHLQNATTPLPPLAQHSFARPTLGQPFALLAMAGTDPALRRVFSIQPGARPDDPTIRPAILLLSDPATALSDLSSLSGPALIIAQSQVPLPGLVPGEHLAGNATPVIPPEQATGAAMPDFIHLDHVHVAAYRAATLSPEWHILATVAGKPWIALRRQNQLTMIWLASLPSSETDWPKDPSFVLFFAEMAHRALSQSDTTRWIDWQPLNDSAPIPSPTTMPAIPLNAYLGTAAIVLLVTATALLALRMRGSLL